MMVLVVVVTLLACSRSFCDEASVKMHSDWRVVRHDMGSTAALRRHNLQRYCLS